ARRLPRAAFRPTPASDAGVLVFARRLRPLVPVDRASAYRSFVARGFRRGVRSVAPASAVARIAVPGATGRDLDAHQWAELFREVGDASGRRAGRAAAAGSRATPRASGPGAPPGMPARPTPRGRRSR